MVNNLSGKKGMAKLFGGSNLSSNGVCVPTQRPEISQGNRI